MVLHRGNGVHARRHRQALALAGERGGGVLGEHEAAVQPALGSQKRGQAARQSWIHQLLDAALDAVGTVPLPPYIHEKLDDPERYQTVYARVPGSSAAPTAGLHLDPEALRQLESAGVEILRLTLHIGLDTFKPLSQEAIDSGTLHGERVELPSQTAAKLLEEAGYVLGENGIRVHEETGRPLRFEIIELKTGQNPVQVLVKAVEFSAPTEDTTRIVYGGTTYHVSVDVAPIRRVDMALKFIADSVKEATFSNPKPIEEHLAEQLILAANNDSNSPSVKKKHELERIAQASR